MPSTPTHHLHHLLRVDASEKAVGAVLEQLPNTTDPVTAEDSLQRKTVPVAFMSRKLTPGQTKSWPMSEKEAYSIILALKKWASWIGLQQVVVLSDHKSLEEWAKETMAKPTGPTGRQAHCHELFRHFKVDVGG